MSKHISTSYLALDDDIKSLKLAFKPQSFDDVLSGLIEILEGDPDETEISYLNELDIQFLIDAFASHTGHTDVQIAEQMRFSVPHLQRFRDYGLDVASNSHTMFLETPDRKFLGTGDKGVSPEVLLEILGAIQDMFLAFEKQDWETEGADENETRSSGTGHHSLEAQGIVVGGAPRIVNSGAKEQTISRWVINPLPNPENHLAYEELVIGLEQLIVDLEASKSFANSESVSETRRIHLVNLVRTVFKLLDAPMIDAEFVDTAIGEFQEFGDEVKEEVKKQVKIGIVKQGMYLFGEIAKFLLGAG